MWPLNYYESCLFFAMIIAIQFMYYLQEKILKLKKEMTRSLKSMRKK